MRRFLALVCVMFFIFSSSIFAIEPSEVRLRIKDSMNEIDGNMESKLNEYRIFNIQIFDKIATDNHFVTENQLVQEWLEYNSYKFADNKLYIKLKDDYDDLNSHKTDMNYIQEKLLDYQLSVTILKELEGTATYLQNEGQSTDILTEYLALATDFKKLMTELDLEQKSILSNTEKLLVHNMPTETFLENLSLTAQYEPLVSYVGDIDQTVGSRKPIFKYIGKNNIEFATPRDLIKSYLTLSEDKYVIKKGVMNAEGVYTETGTNQEIDIVYDKPVLNTEMSLTTLIMYNNLIEKKDNIRRGALDKPMVMDGMGNILTADNMVLVPASINEVFYKDNTAMPVLSKAFTNSYPKMAVSEKKLTLVNKVEENKLLIVRDGAEYKAEAAAKYAINTKQKPVFRGSKPIGPIEVLSMPLSGKQVDIFKYHNADKKGFYVPNTDINIMEYTGFRINKEGVMRDINSIYDEDNEVLSNYFLYYLSKNKIDTADIQNEIIERGSVHYKIEMDKNGEFGKETQALGGLASGLSGLGKQKGFIGINNFLENPVTKFIYINKSYVTNIVMLLVIIVMVFRFLQKGHDFWAVGIFILITYGTCLFLLNVVPKYIPVVSNVFTTKASENVVYGSLILNNEMSINESMNFISYSTDIPELSDPSITLAKQSESDLELTKLRYSDDDFNNYINNEIYLGYTGTYLYNDELRIKIRDLFDNLKVEGAYVYEDGISYYKTTIAKEEKSNIDYFTPYNLITDQFVKTLNFYSKVGGAPRRMVHYNDKSKDSFLVNGYFKSVLFFYPGNKDYIKAFMEEYNEGFVFDTVIPTLNEMGLENEITDNDHESVSRYMFDFLGIHNILSRPDVKDTLWYRTALHNTDFNYDELVIGVNAETAKFALQMIDRFPYVSDETLIKVISLYATCEFNNAISSFGYSVYPLHINSEEINLNTLLQTVLMAEDDINSPTSIDLAYFISTKVDFIGPLALIIIYLIETFNGIILSIFIESLFYILMILIMFRIIFSPDNIIYKAAIKLTLTWVVLYYANHFKYNLAYMTNDIYIKLVILVVGGAITTFFLSKIITSLVKDPINLGVKTSGGKTVSMLDQNETDKKEKYEQESYKGSNNISANMRKLYDTKMLKVEDLEKAKNLLRKYKITEYKILDRNYIKFENETDMIKIMEGLRY